MDQPDVGDISDELENIDNDQESFENIAETSENNETRIIEQDTIDGIDSACGDEVVLCLFYRKGKLAAAVYYAETCEMHIMYDVSDLAPDFKLLCSLFLQLKPTQVVTCRSLPELFLRKIHSLVTGEDVSISPTADPPSYSDKFHFIPAKEFRYTSCKRSILELKLPIDLDDTTEADLHTYIMSLIDLSAEVLVSAVGGLLYFLQRSLPRITLTASAQMPILRIQTLSLKNVVWMDEETMHALQIFSPVVHPSSFKWSSGATKEGLSIFSILNRCYSTSGARHMRVMLSQPKRDKDVLHSRHQVISFCLASVNEQTVKSLADSIIHIKSVMKILTRMTNAQASVAQWKAFYDTIYNAVLVGEVCKANSKDVIFFQEIADCLCDSIFVMSHCIYRTMDFESSFIHNRVVIKEGISGDLDSLKEKQAHVGQIMDQIAEEELKELPEYVQTCSMLYIPGSGYVIALPAWDADLANMKSLPNLHFQFSNEDIVYYKSARCFELDNLLGDVHMNIIEIESKIILKLVEYIQRNITPLVKLTGLIAELDCLLALTQAARDFNLVQPILTSEKQIHITKGRHILQELYVDMFVPNNTHSSQEYGFVKILTGPNASGKSVYLKQVALITYLAHIGSFVPAEKAVVGIVDQIHICIQPVESVSTQLSAFMVDLRKMALAIRNATCNSLVIVDELGKGTSEVDGLGILAACLEYFVEKKQSSPHLFVSTHFHSLSKMLPSSDSIKLQTGPCAGSLHMNHVHGISLHDTTMAIDRSLFDVHLEHMVDKGELVYLYRLKEGVMEASFALQIAQNHCLTPSNVERATEILNGLRNSGDLTIDRNNKLAQVTTRRRTYLKNLSKAVLDDEQLNMWKKQLIGLPSL